jgi:Domain of unknown function (DUF1905)
MKTKSYVMTEKIWLYTGGMAAWHFITLTKKVGQEIKEAYGKSARGFGSLPVEVTIGKTVWKTSIFPDKRVGSYLLPIKAQVRKQEGIEAGDLVKFSIVLL